MRLATTEELIERIEKLEAELAAAEVRADDNGQAFLAERERADRLADTKSHLSEQVLALTIERDRLRQALERIASGGGRAEVFGLKLLRCPQCASAEIAREALNFKQQKGEK